MIPPPAVGWYDSTPVRTNAFSTERMVIGAFPLIDQRGEFAAQLTIAVTQAGVSSSLGSGAQVEGFLWFEAGRQVVPFAMNVLGSGVNLPVGGPGSLTFDVPAVGEAEIALSAPVGDPARAVVLSFMHRIDDSGARYSYDLHAVISSYHKVVVSGRVGAYRIDPMRPSGDPRTMYRAESSSGGSIYLEN